MRDALKRLFSRELSEKSSIIQEDLRKVGLVSVGAGIIGVIMQNNLSGFWLIIIGLIAWGFGLTEQRNEDVGDS